MKVITSWVEMQKIALGLKRRGQKIGLVPTMGALHQGHLSLIRKARRKSDQVIVSLFVNPLQFGSGEDFKNYPRDFEKDLRILKNEKVAYLFFPPAKEIYPRDFLTEVEVKKLGDVLCGRSRPGHFKGVATVVLKLFNIVQPDLAFFGEKDYQQLVIIKQMVKDLNLPVNIMACPIIREKSGLAFSSRNQYLAPSAKKSAAVLCQALLKARQMIKNGEKSAPKIIMVLRSLIEAVPNTKIDYLALVNPQTLQAVRKIDRSVCLLLAVRVAGVRLIDNLLL